MSKATEKQLLLGIDGGASKTEFLLTDFNLKPLKSLKIGQGSNPWHLGLDQTLKVIEKGLKSFDPALLKKVVFLYAGISGCFGDSRYNEQINSCLKGYVKNKRVSGDLYSSFRSLSRSKYGLLAIAGTGSAMAHFDKDDRNSLMGLAFGGRDFGYLILRNLIKGNLEDRKYLKSFLEQNVDIEYLRSSKLDSWLKHRGLVDLAAKLSTLEYEDNVFKELKIFMDLVVDRWVYKIFAYACKYSYQKRSKFELVLSGNFWRFTYIRKAVIKELKDYLPNAQVRYSEKIRPVIGCVKLAKECYLEQGEK